VVTHYPGVDPSPNQKPRLGLTVSGNWRVDGSDIEYRKVLAEVQREDGTVGIEERLDPVRWIGGFSYRPEKCNGGATFDPKGSLPSLDGPENEIDVLPFEVMGSDTVSLFGAANPELMAERVDYARRDYDACESKQIEAELWKGTLTRSIGSGNRFLADANVSLVEGDRLLGYLTALAALEKAINEGTCGAQGMIHARADTVSLWDAGGALRRVGNMIFTIHDTIIVPGSGYDGSAPVAGAVGMDPAHAGKVPSTDSAWAYATTVVDLRRSAEAEPQTMLQRVNPSSTSGATSNVLNTWVRRYVAATWGCFQAAVHVDHTQALTITGS
jgi:hypothetical protein